MLDAMAVAAWTLDSILDSSKSGQPTLGSFLSDARTHQGTSGAPVFMRVSKRNRNFRDLPWMLTGIHSARLDVGTRDIKLVEALGLSCAWYADILTTLTKS